MSTFCRGDRVRITFPQTRPFTATVVELQARGRTLVQTSEGQTLAVAARLCEALEPEAPDVEPDLGAEVLQVRLVQVRSLGK